MHIFISHSSKEAAIAENVCNILEQNGKKCFLAPRDIQAGKEYAEEIINGIDNAETILLLMSEAANQSPHVLREIERAVSKNIPILVYKLEEVELSKSMEYFLMTHQWVNAKCRSDYTDVLSFFDKEISVNTKLSNKKDKNVFKQTLLIIMLAVILLVVGIIIYKALTKTEPNLSVGDTVTLGTYNEEPITWRVLKLSDDGREAVLVSEKILSMKAYDAAEGGKYNTDGNKDYWHEGTEADTDLKLQILVRGNNDWSISNIRTWLNSASEVVEYMDQAPASSAMSVMHNGYQNEPGFLHGFSEEEQEVILETAVETLGNAMTNGEVITTTDKVYLLSQEELEWFSDAGISHYAVPTRIAIEQDDSGWYQMYSLDYCVDAYLWWLRTPVDGTSSKCYLVGNGYAGDGEDLYEENVSLEGYGIRPAITVDARAELFEEK